MPKQVFVPPQAPQRSMVLLEYGKPSQPRQVLLPPHTPHWSTNAGPYATPWQSRHRLLPLQTPQLSTTAPECGIPSHPRHVFVPLLIVHWHNRYTDHKLPTVEWSGMITKHRTSHRPHGRTQRPDSRSSCWSPRTLRNCPPSPPNTAHRLAK